MRDLKEYNLLLRGTYSELDFLLPMFLSEQMALPEKIFVSPVALENNVKRYLEAFDLKVSTIIGYEGEKDYSNFIEEIGGGRLKFHLRYSIRSCYKAMYFCLTSKALVTGWDKRPSNIVVDLFSWIKNIYFVPTSIDATRRRTDIQFNKVSQKGWVRRKLLVYKELSDDFSLDALRCRNFEICQLELTNLDEIVLKFRLSKQRINSRRRVVIALSALNFVSDPKRKESLLTEYLTTILNALIKKGPLDGLDVCIIPHPRHDARILSLVFDKVNRQFAIKISTFYGLFSEFIFGGYIDSDTRIIVGPSGVRGWLDLLKIKYIVYVPYEWDKENDRSVAYSAKYSELRRSNIGAGNIVEILKLL